MEPPAKRFRRDPSWPSDTDDELAFDPFDVPDQGPIGSEDEFERAMEETDNRFQSAMAHIFEKYSRDFEGVGDEIDMYTGEVVVDNGHISKMRHERDVGLPGWMDEGQDEEQEEGGLRLSDLIDEASFLEEPRETNVNDSTRHIEAVPQIPESAGGLPGAPGLDAATSDHTETGEIPHMRAQANRARLQGRRSSTPTDTEGSIWRPGNTPPKKSETFSKPPLGQESSLALIHATHEREAEAFVSAESAVNSDEETASASRNIVKTNGSTEGEVPEQTNGAESIIGREPRGRPRKTTTKASNDHDLNEKPTTLWYKDKDAAEMGIHEDAEGRRRSSRASIPVDYLGKIPWNQVRAERRAGTKSAALPPFASSERDGQLVPAPSTSTSASAAISRAPSVIANSQETQIPSSGEYIANSDQPSQTGTSRSSQIQSSQASQKKGSSQSKTAQSQQSWESLYDLSDDEMPMQLPALNRSQPTLMATTREWTSNAETTSKQERQPQSRGSEAVSQDSKAKEQGQHASVRVMSEDPSHGVISVPDLEKDTGDHEAVGPTQDHMERSTVVERVADTIATQGSPGSATDDTPDIQLYEAEQSDDEQRGASPDLSTPQHVRTRSVEIPESPDGEGSVPPSSSPAKLHSSPTKHRALLRAPEPTLSNRQDPPQNFGTGTPDATPSSPSTSRANRLHRDSQAQASSRAIRSPVSVYSSRSIWDRRASPPRTSKRTSPKKSSPLKQATTNPSIPQTPSFRTKRKIATPSSRNSLLSFTRDKDDVDELSEVIGQSDERLPRRRDTLSGRIAHGTSTPSSAGRKARLPYRSRVSLGAQQSEMGEVVQSPGGTMRVCGVDGFRCDRDFCFSCL